MSREDVQSLDTWGYDIYDSLGSSDHEIVVFTTLRGAQYKPWI